MSLILSISALSVLLCLAGCDAPVQCEDTIVSKVTSPDGIYEATSWVRNCGATTTYSVHVFVGAKGAAIEPERGIVFRGSHSDQIAIRWKDNRTLEIRTDAEVFQLMKQYSGISFELVRS